MSLHYYHAGEAYDVSSELAEYLVAEGFAWVEMRQRQRSSRPRAQDRRRGSGVRKPRGQRRADESHVHRNRHDGNRRNPR